MAVGEKATADDGAVLGGLPVAVEEVGFMGFRWWHLRYSWWIWVYGVTFIASFWFSTVCSCSCRDWLAWTGKMVGFVGISAKFCS